MSQEVFIPQLGQTVEQVTLLRWLVQEGAAVAPGDGILEVETDKTNFTVEAETGGIVHLGPFQPGDTLPVQTVVARVGRAEDTFSPPAPAPVGPADKESKQRFASPRARTLAARENVDLGLVQPTGDDGRRIIERDVQAFLDRTPPAARDEDASWVRERVPLRGVRAVIARRIAASVQTTARTTLFMEADATELVSLREKLGARVAAEWGFAPGYNDLIAKLTADALKRFPYMNARLTAEAVELLEPINLGLATDTERGLLVPVVREADRKSLREFGLEYRALVERARRGEARPEDLSGGTFTLTNLGMFDVLAFTPIINPPEAAILGLGVITPQPVVRQARIVVRQMLVLSLAFDHRLVDGAPAARFLQYLKQQIEEPYLWLAGYAAP